MGLRLAHHQSLVPERLSNFLKLGAFLPESTRECMPQVMPVKPNDISIFQGTLKPGTWTTDRFAGFFRDRKSPA
jgi:hypothetical protein